MTFSIQLPPRVRATLRALPKAVKRRIGHALQLLQQDPMTPRPGCDVKLLRARGDRRLPVGDCRIIFYVDREETKLYITSVERRRGGTYD